MKAEDRGETGKQERGGRPVPDEELEPPAGERSPREREAETRSGHQTGDMGFRFFIAPEQTAPDARNGHAERLVVQAAVRHFVRKDDGQRDGGRGDSGGYVDAGISMPSAAD